MSNFSVIHDVSIELRRQIFEALAATPDTEFGVTSVERVTLKSPGETMENNTVASLFLYHLDIDAHLRNQRPLPDASRDDRFHRPPLPLLLRYIFTPVGDDETENQLLLGRVLQHFHDFPSFPSLSGKSIGNSRGAASPELRVVPDLLPVEQLTQLWNAFSAPYRTVISLLVEVVALDSGLPPAQRRRVEEMLPGVGQMAEES
jgi:hypothetical protein